MTRNTVRIVPPEAFNGIVRTQGTQVFVGDQRLDCVSKIILTAELNDVWKAEIHCDVNMVPMELDAIILQPKPWWQRLVNWIVGPEPEPAYKDFFEKQDAEKKDRPHAESEE